MRKRGPSSARQYGSSSQCYWMAGSEEVSLCRPLETEMLRVEPRWRLGRRGVLDAPGPVVGLVSRSFHLIYPTLRSTSRSLPSPPATRLFHQGYFFLSDLPCLFPSCWEKGGCSWLLTFHVTPPSRPVTGQQQTLHLCYSHANGLSKRSGQDGRQDSANVGTMGRSHGLHVLWMGCRCTRWCAADEGFPICDEGMLHQ